MFILDPSFSTLFLSVVGWLYLFFVYRYQACFLGAYRQLNYSSCSKDSVLHCFDSQLRMLIQESPC